MEIEISYKKEFVIARFKNTSKLTLISVEAIISQLQPIMLVPNSKLILDLQEIHFVDSSIIGCFIALAKSGNAHHSSVTIGNVNEQVSTIFNLLRLSNFLRIENSIDDIYKQAS